MDQYVSLLLLYMFNPICTSLRSLQQASELAEVQKKLGVPRASLGSLSEAATVFDSRQMVEVIGELGKQLQPLAVHDKLQNLPGTLTAVDGTLLKALPKITWALWIDEQHKAVKNHVHFEILKGVPVAATLTDGNGNEKDVLAAHLQAGRIYVLDRGYAKYELLQQIREAHSSFVCHIRDSGHRHGLGGPGGGCDRVDFPALLDHRDLLSVLQTHPGLPASAELQPQRDRVADLYGDSGVHADFAVDGPQADPADL